MTGAPTFIQVQVSGTPRAQGSKTGFVVQKKGGKPRAVVVDRHGAPLDEWRTAVADATRQVMGDRPPFDEAMVLEVTFGLPRLKTVERIEPTTPPDLDKLLRAVFDALKTGGLFVDDARVVRVVMDKVYAEEPGATIVAFPLNNYGRDGAADLAELMMSED